MILTRAGIVRTTVGEPRIPSTKKRGMKPKIMMRNGETMPRVGMGGISQAVIDRVHILVNLGRAAKGKEPADFSQPIPKPKLWRKRSA